MWRMHLSVSRKIHANESNFFIGGGQIMASLGNITFKNRTVLHWSKSNGQYKHWTTLSDEHVITKTAQMQL